MELVTFLIILADWIQSSDTTDCTLYTRPERTMINLHCPNAMCRFQVQNPHGSDCNTNPDGNTPYCYINDCNGVYNIRKLSSQNASNDSSSRCRELSSGGQTVYSNEQPINCTVTLIPNMIYLRCRKGECNHTARSPNTSCSRDLGIDCGVGEASCNKTYSIHTATEQPTITSKLLKNETITNGMTCTCPECTLEINTTRSNYCNKTVIVQSCTNEVTVTIHSIKETYVPTIMQMTACPSPTTTPKYPNTGMTDVLNTSSFTSVHYPSPSTLSPTSETCESATHTMIPLIIVASTTGALVILLLVVITGWVCTCRIMKKRGKMKINVMQDRPCTNEDQHTHQYTETRTRFDNPLKVCEQQQQSTCTIPPSTKPKLPQRQGKEPVYAISLVTHRRDIEEPKNVQNRPNHPKSGGGVSVGGATLIQKKQGEIEHKYDHLVKVVKQTDRGQSKRDEIISLERNYKHQTVNKQERDTTYHVQDYLIPIKQESKSFQNRPNKALFPDGCASVGVVTQFPPRKQGEIEHQYDHLIEVGKQKGSQSKRDERVNGEITDHDYHVLEGPDNDHDDLDKQERETVYHILDGPTPLEPELKTFQNGPKKVFPVEGVSMGGASQLPRKQNACEHQYDHLVKKKRGQCKRDARADEESDHGYHVLEGPGDDDYDYPDEREGEIVYHVLDGPTPVEEETQFTY